MPDAVLFDFNGVLVDDEHVHHAAFNDVLRPLGVTMSHEAYTDRYLGFDDRGAFVAVLRDFGRDAPEGLVDRLIARKADVYAERARSDLRIFPRAAEVLARVARARPVGIVSGALRREIESALEQMAVREHVRFIVAAEDVSACKPDPEGYRAAIARLVVDGVRVDTARVVAVEDSIAGIASARDAGLAVVAVAHTYPRASLVASGAALVLDAIAELDDAALSRAVD